MSRDTKRSFGRLTGKGERTEEGRVEEEEALEEKGLGDWVMCAVELRVLVWA